MKEAGWQDGELLNVVVLPAFQIQPGGDRAALQESRDRSDAGKGPTNVSPTGQTAAARRRGERQVDIPQTDADHSRDQVRGKLRTDHHVMESRRDFLFYRRCLAPRCGFLVVERPMPPRYPKRLMTLLVSIMSRLTLISILLFLVVRIRRR